MAGGARTSLHSFLPCWLVLRELHNKYNGKERTLVPGYSRNGLPWSGDTGEVTGTVVHTGSLARQEGAGYTPGLARLVLLQIWWMWLVWLLAGSDKRMVQTVLIA